MINAVLFDVDGVLIDSFEANLKLYQDLMVKAGYRPPTREEFPDIFHLTMWDGIEKLTQLTGKEEIRKIWTMAYDEIRYPLELLKTPMRLEETIQILYEHYRLGIVTNRTRVYEVPHLAKLQSYFKIAVAYQDTVNHKPHPEPLLLAAKRLDVLPEESVYVGDVENDVQAGRAAGMKVVIYSKEHLASADACVTSFSQLPECIAAL